MKQQALYFFFVTLVAGDIMAQTELQPDLIKRLNTQCSSCHGTTGVSTQSQWPTLAGQKKSYLIKQLRDFKSGLRKNIYMNHYAKTIGDQEIELIASAYASLSPKNSLSTSVQNNLNNVSESPQRPVTLELCIACHGSNGQSSVDLFPNLRGQHFDYLFGQLKAFKSMTRIDPTMNPLAAKLSEDDLIKLAKWYSEQK